MKKNAKIKIRRLIDLKEKDGLQKSVQRLKDRRVMLVKKQCVWSPFVSRHMKYIDFHLQRLGYVEYVTPTGRINPPGPAIQHMIAKGKSFFSRDAGAKKLI